LTDDVNKYLTGVKIPNTFSQPITFQDLLTHTRWKQIEPMLFVLTDGVRAGEVHFGFKENSKGENAFMFYDAFNVFERVSQ
jgi:hypothetical protein